MFSWVDELLGTKCKVITLHYFPGQLCKPTRLNVRKSIGNVLLELWKPESKWFCHAFWSGSFSSTVLYLK
jgi:hypothetical protein